MHVIAEVRDLLRRPQLHASALVQSKIGDGERSEAPCDLCPIYGACCFDNNECAIIPEQDCLSEGYTFLGLGSSCDECGQIHLPHTRVCIKCHAKDKWTPVRLSDKEGRILAYTFDYFFPAAEPPTIMVMTEVEGCRVQVQLANTKPDQVRLDMPVEYVFRKIHDAGGKANYFWKASPILDSENAGGANS